MPSHSYTWPIWLRLKGGSYLVKEHTIHPGDWALWEFFQWHPQDALELMNVGNQSGWFFKLDGVPRNVKVTLTSERANPRSYYFRLSRPTGSGPVLQQIDPTDFG
jgi:hypothetical protein